MPLWMYCDDTSGNVSKKWNEHNSFLFTLAGLTREETAKEYIVHFLCTSNLVPPLEMLDGVLDQIEYVFIFTKDNFIDHICDRRAQKTGVWTWDCELNEPILIFPTVLALLGDNPMHSEFASHIGLRGKYFCRTCWVKGTDALDEANIVVIDLEARDRQEAGTGASEHESEASADGLSGQSDSDASQASQTPKKKGKFVESMSAMMIRISSFIKVCIICIYRTLLNLCSLDRTVALQRRNPAHSRLILHSGKSGRQQNKITKRAYKYGHQRHHSRALF